ncbi:hypothetical protein HP548_23605 [Paenibacillus taichungensis]|uniref:Uncharacterized protein n=1 Tax=Paenibacillus taichungensis TaxID=484184 RepID=A0ABX2MSJ8_9BACL|nr:hypothetical protein [Paenibacillus taichungensis]NUU57071.1 hypothetical protein [Paenibacillus taichungensis]
MYRNTKIISLTIPQLDISTRNITKKLNFSKPLKVETFGDIPSKPGIIVSINQDGKFFVSHSYNMRQRLIQLPTERYTKGIVYCMYAELKGHDDRLSARNAMKVQIDLYEYKKNGISSFVQ